MSTKGRRLQAWGVGIALAVAGFSLTACDEWTFGPFRIEASEVEHRALPAEGSVRLVVESSNGRVTVRGESGLQATSVTATKRSRGQTLADAERRLDQLEYTVTSDGVSILLRYRQADQPGDVGRYSGVDFEVVVPQQAEVEVRTSNGSIEVGSIMGPVHLVTSNGAIHLQESVGTAYLATSNGRVSVADGVGDLTIRTSNGEIRLERVRGRVDGETSNGWIHYAGQPEGSALNRLRTSNGGVVVRVPRAAAIAFRASVSNGSISTDLFLVGGTEGRNWNAVLNPPAATEMDLRTSNGTIRIEAAD